MILIHSHFPLIMKVENQSENYCLMIKDLKIKPQTLHDKELSACSFNELPPVMENPNTSKNKGGRSKCLFRHCFVGRGPHILRNYVNLSTKQ